MSSTAQRSKKDTSDVIDVLRELLARGDSDAVIELVTKLMSTHDKQLRDMFESARRRSTKNEGIDSAQLSLLVDELTKMAEQTAKDANDKLAAVAPVPPCPRRSRRPIRGLRRRVVGPSPSTCRVSTTRSRSLLGCARARSAA